MGEIDINEIDLEQNIGLGPESGQADPSPENLEEEEDLNLEGNEPEGKIVDEDADDIFGEDSDDVFIDELEDGKPKEDLPMEPEKAAEVEPAKDKPVAQEPAPKAEDSFPAELVPGTVEYTKRVSADAIEAVKKLFGVKEFDQFDPEHMAAFNRAHRKIDDAAEKFYEDKKQEVADQANYKTALATADQECDTILNTPELQAKFEDALENKLTVKQFREIHAKAIKGDFSGFISIAKKVAGLQEKMNVINNRQKPVEQPQPQKVVEYNDEDDGVSTLLGI